VDPLLLNVAGLLGVVHDGADLLDLGFRCAGQCGGFFRDRAWQNLICGFATRVLISVITSSRFSLVHDNDELGQLRVGQVASVTLGGDSGGGIASCSEPPNPRLW
jgi:hypothetical protein